MLDRTQLVAPFDGVVIHCELQPGQLAGPSQPPLVTIADLSQIRVRAYVEELDALSVSPGQAAYVTADGRPGVRFPGTVVACASRLQPKRLLRNKSDERVDVKVREVIISLRHADGLIVGLPVDVFIQCPRGADKKLLPDDTPKAAE